ncbi:claudin-10 isoform X2 [Acinonyx jubatus]|uniref:Claudin-10 isoform X2 n=1 Tax=Acinonyx jubatus TaxID=32536 RepID=A0ABM3PN90_ACIJB|nr:claudin-10 isoform X2 [Acinonyx jubatus]
MSRAQISALVFGVGGFGALVAATASNEWKVTTRASSVITATWVYQGLWMNCAGNALGSFHCRPHFTIFKVEGYIQACRGLMIAAVSLGFFGSIFALFGMKCTKVGGSDKAKAKIACLAGIVFILSGLCSMTGCSLYANKITTEFFDPLYVEQKPGASAGRDHILLILESLVPSACSMTFTARRLVSSVIGLSVCISPGVGRLSVFVDIWDLRACHVDMRAGGSISTVSKSEALDPAPPGCLGGKPGSAAYLLCNLEEGPCLFCVLRPSSVLRRWQINIQLFRSMHHTVGTQ